MEHCEVSERDRHTKGVCDFPCDRKPFLGGLQGAVGKPEMPIAVADISAGENAHIDAKDLRMKTAAIITDFHTLLNPVAGDLKFAKMECRCPSEIVSFYEHRRVANSARKGDRFVD